MKIPKLISNVTTFIFFFCDSRAFHMTVLITSWRRWLDSVRFNLFSALLISSFSFSFFFLFSTHFISFHFEMFVLILISSEWVWEKYISILVAVIAQQQHQPLASQPSIHPAQINPMGYFTFKSDFWRFPAHSFTFRADSLSDVRCCLFLRRSTCHVILWIFRIYERRRVSIKLNEKLAKVGVDRSETDRIQIIRMQGQKTWFSLVTA